MRIFDRHHVSPKHFAQTNGRIPGRDRAGRLGHRRAGRPWLIMLVSLFCFGVLENRAATTYFVATNGIGLGTNGWADATNNLQGAIDAIESSSVTNTVWVSNGVYEVGGRTNYPTGTVLTNRVVITKAITVRSANNDPTNTVIRGTWDPVTTNGLAAVRCVYMVAGSSLIGFMLTNGATLRTNETTEANALGGGGALNGLISNCVIAGNSGVYGGGARSSTLYNSLIVGNSGVYGGGLFLSTASNCTIVGNSTKSADAFPARGGGGAQCTLYNCIIASNSATWAGGAVASVGSAYNCLLVGNSAQYGGGSYETTLYNCTIVGNSASSSGSGIYVGTLYNCIVYSNSVDNYVGGTFTNCCTTPTPVGTGNITNYPMFIANGSGYGTSHIAGNYHLSPNSLCINKGTNQAWMTNSVDYDGTPRIRYGTVDMGCYETIYDGTMFRVP